MASKEALDKVARVRKKHGMKSLRIAILESDLWDWNPTKRLLLLVLQLGTRTEKEDYSKTFVQEDCPKTAEELVGWCDMAQWRLALRVGCTEKYIQELLIEFEKEGVINIDRWDDNNGVHHDMYRIVEDVVRDRQRPEQKKGVERPPRYKVKRGANKGSFSTANQPGRTANQRAIVKEDDE
jgi:hypothetical protein